MIECYGGPWDGRLVEDCGWRIRVLLEGRDEAGVVRTGLYVRGTSGYHWHGED
jgi:hypothetical protein